MTEPQFVEDVTELNSWKQQAAAGSASDTVVLRKQFISDVQVHGDRSIKFIITTGDADRENDVIDPTGWDVSNYLKNPVVLFAHDYGSLPIARTTKLEQHDDHLVAIAEFATEDLNPMAEQVFNMLKQGFLRGASVGFRPTVFEYNNDRGGVDFSGQELLEFSVVPIPANAQSLMAAGVKEKDVSCIKQWAEKTLEVLSETKQPISDQLDDFLDVIRKQMNDIKVSVKETVRNVDEFQNSFQYSAPRSLSSSVEKGISPRNVSEETAPMDTPWSRPNLGDFVDEPWESLSATQKTKIAGHYAWATAASPDTFGDMKLPHHRADDGYVVWRGVVAAAGRLDQTNFPSEDMNAVKRHLANHFKEFDREAPWERDAVSWSKYLRNRNEIQGDHKEPLPDRIVAELLFEYGFKDEAASLVDDPTSLVDSDQEIVIRGVVDELAPKLDILKHLVEKTGQEFQGTQEVMAVRFPEQQPEMRLVLVDDADEIHKKDEGNTEDIVLVLDDSEPTESSTIDVEPEALAHAMRHALGETLTDIVTAETRSAINTMRGRID